MIRIGNSGVGAANQGSVAAVREAEDSDSSSAGTSGSKSDSVILSGATSLIELAKNGAALNSPKLQTLSAALKSGRYQAENSQVSRAIVSSHIAE